MRRRWPNLVEGLTWYGLIPLPVVVAILVIDVVALIVAFA